MPLQKNKELRIPSGTKWDNTVGYSRAVRVGNLIFVAGTTSVSNGKIIGKGNAYLQTKFILKKIERTLKQCSAGMNDVVRTRIFTTDISQWKKIGEAHAEFFRKIKPAATMVEVKSLIEPGLLVEIEADAVLSE